MQKDCTPPEFHPLLWVEIWRGYHNFHWIYYTECIGAAKSGIPDQHRDVSFIWWNCHNRDNHLGKIVYRYPHICTTTLETTSRNFAPDCRGLPDLRYSLLAKSITWSQSNRACLSLTEDKIESRRPHREATAEGSCSKGLGKHFEDKSQEQTLVMFVGSRLQVAIDLKGFSSN